MSTLAQRSRSPAFSGDPQPLLATVGRVGALTAIGAVALFAPEAFAAGGGTPIDQAATNAVDIAQGLGVAACTAGVIGTCAGAIMRSGAFMAGGATTAVAGGAWAGAPDVVQQLIGGGAGVGLSDLAVLQPATIDVLGTLASLVTSLFA
ncbi:hypothetical protein [Defluviicoccus vanus]|uniref:Uncharacterized protein n=1 Tax=Defluviicoccus vanus TaxID=111831 RepID=A0A7H1N6Y6_9PROT|nr:hypothetical protein [Defluviicoccus vanus]QNT71472.1 hypothetical protein HQ394_19235 [Defluviicoccus vanus]